ncbi:MAG: putative nucleotide-diphospho-sugar transferase, partial [Lentisphaeria bacterium]|nr:putative nucleotide-diphospho-sugar transferase [Lentisphaeria bacterium]
MARVAVASVRVSNPDYHVVVIVDEQSAQAMKAADDPLLAEADQWIAVNTGLGPAAARSRFVKTSMRQVLDGPFVFLDTDVVVRGSLDDVFGLDADAAGARNNSRSKLEEQYWWEDMAILEKMGWSIGGEAFINSGVLFFADTVGARRLGEEWHRRWREEYDRLGQHRDQPGMNSALHALGVRFKLLPDTYNAQFRMNAAVAWKPLVWHYYASGSISPETVFGDLVRDLVSGGELDMDRVGEMVRSPHPWRRRGPLGELGLRLFLQYCQKSGWY